MIRHTLFILAPFVLLGCDGEDLTRSSALPDNVTEDRPIVIREGQAIVLVPDGDRSIMIGASVVDGKLTISEIDPAGKSLSVTWNDKDTWETSVIDSREDQTTITIDKSGDGLPNLRTVKTADSLLRYRLEEPQWIEQQR